MVSGESRWVLREDIHVYCMAPMGQPATYALACPSAGLDAETWTTADHIASQIQSILTSDAR